MKKLIVLLLMSTTIQLAGQSLNPGIVLADPSKVNTLEENAIAFYTQQLEFNPEDVHALMLRSELYRALGQTEAANEDLRSALAINPYARLYLNREYRKEMFPKKSYSYVSLANKDGGSADFDKSFLLTKQYLEMINGSELIANDAELIDRVLTALLNQDLDDAQTLLNEVEPTDSNAALYHDIKGLLELKAGNPAEAIVHFDQSLDINPNFVTAYHNRAVANKKLGRLEAAEEDFNSALQINSSIAQLHFGKGSLLELRGDIPEAMAHYQAASSYDGQYHQASTNYSSLLKSTGEYTEALIEINQLIDDNPEIPENYYVRGGLHFIYGEYTNAIKDLERYLQSNTTDGEALFYLGLSKLMNNDKTDGCRDISESLNQGYQPSNSDIMLYMCN